MFWLHCKRNTNMIIGYGLATVVNTVSLSLTSLVIYFDQHFGTFSVASVVWCKCVMFSGDFSSSICIRTSPSCTALVFWIKQWINRLSTYIYIDLVAIVLLRHLGIKTFLYKNVRSSSDSFSCNLRLTSRCGWLKRTYVWFQRQFLSVFWIGYIHERYRRRAESAACWQW